MAFLTPKVGRLQDAEAIRVYVLTGCEVALVTTPPPLDDDDTLPDLEALEAAWTGYARQTPSVWSTSIIDVSAHAITFADLVSFTVTSGGTGQTVYGYFVVTNGDLHHEEELSTPITVTDGVPVSLLIKYWVQTP